jgi:hypothetical protein
MSDVNRYDAIIDRYINGRMNPAEEADFRKLLELDGELRRLLEADRRMVATMRAEREALERIDHAESYSRFLMGLASSVPSATEEGSAAPTSPTPDTEEHGSRWPLLIPGLLLLGAVLFALVSHDPMPTGPRTKTSPRLTPSAPERPAVSQPTPSYPPPQARQEALSRSTDTGSSERGGINDRPISPRIGRGDSGHPSEKTPPQAKPAPERKREEIPTFEDDTIRTRLRMERSNR